MKQLYCILLGVVMVGLNACSKDKYVIDHYATMRFDILALPTPSDTLALNTVDFVSATQGFVAGNGGSFFATTDAGQTWARHAQPTLGNFNKLLFSSPTTGWAGTSNGLYRTTNGGQNWQSVPAYNIYGDAIPVQDIQFVTSQIGYVVGDEGGICKTIDGGATWFSLQNQPSIDDSFRAVSFSSPDSGTVVGGKQSFWTTVDGGNNWTQMETSSSNSDLNHDVLRYNATTYLLAGLQGFEAHDASQIYGYKPDETYGYPVYGIASFGGPSGSVVAVGERTIIRRQPDYSQNAGTPWVSVHTPDGTTLGPQAVFYAADFADAVTFYTVGAKGIIYRFHYQ